MQSRASSGPPTPWGLKKDGRGGGGGAFLTPEGLSTVEYRLSTA